MEARQIVEAVWTLQDWGWRKGFKGEIDRVGDEVLRDFEACWNIHTLRVECPDKEGFKGIPPIRGVREHCFGFGDPIVAEWSIDRFVEEKA